MGRIRISALQFAGLVLALLGLAMVMRRAFQWEFLDPALPGIHELGRAWPLFFVAASVCCWALPPKKGRVDTVSRLAAGLAVSLLILAPIWALVEHNSAAGLAAQRGRLAPSASLAFLLAGIAFVIGHKDPTPTRDRVLLGLIFGISSIGLLGLAGHFLRLDLLYGAAAYNRMAAPAAFGLTVLGAALWLLREQLRTQAPGSFKQHARRITRRSFAVLALIALSSGVAGFALLRDSFEQAIADKLLLTATSNASSLANVVELGLSNPRNAAVRPEVLDAFRKLRAAATYGDAKATLQSVGESLLATGVTGVRFHGAAGTAIVSTGTMARDTSTLTNTLQGTEPSSLLLWQDGYVLYGEADVVEGGRVLGRVATEQRLPLFDLLLTDIRNAGTSVDALVCSREQDAAVCAPSRFHAAPLRVPMFDSDAAMSLPITHALVNESGVIATQDIGGAPVVAAYAPVKTFGLALVVKTDVATLYAPLKGRAELLIAALIVLVALGTYALRSQVLPLVTQLADEQQRTKVILTERRAAEQKLAASEKRLRAITDNLPVLISYIDRDLKLRFANGTFRDWMGVDPEKIVGLPLIEVVGPVLYDQRREFLVRALRGERVEFEVVSEALGVTRHLQNVYIPDIDGDGRVTGLYGLSTDVTAMKRVEQHLAELALVDSLTGLPNRRRFEGKLEEALARSERTQRPMALMFLDVDHFKLINDTHGHGVGDAVLKEFSRRLRDSVRRTDTVARLAGDEFVVILEGLTADGEASRLAQKIGDSLRPVMNIANESLRVTASIGVAVFNGGEVSPQSLIAKADDALYRAKHAGRDTFALSTY